jgi:hypothetical protein
LSVCLKYYNILCPPHVTYSKFFLTCDAYALFVWHGTHILCLANMGHIWCLSCMWHTSFHVFLACSTYSIPVLCMLYIESEGRLRSKIYDKRYDFNFPILNFPFICSNIPAAPACGVYISRLLVGFVLLDF